MTTLFFIFTLRARLYRSCVPHGKQRDGRRGWGRTQFVPGQSRARDIHYRKTRRAERDEMKRLALSVILALLLSACAGDESNSRGHRGRYGPEWECEKVFLAGHGYGQNYPPSCGR